MTKEQVEETLHKYLEYGGRCEHLKNEIALLSSQIDDWKRTMIQDDISITASYSGMPHGTTVSSNVERLAILYADGYVPESIEEMEKALSVLQREYNEKIIVVELVDGWLKWLTDMERFIVEKQIINNEFWRQVIFQFKSVYGDEYSRDAMKRIKNAALEKICARSTGRKNE